ncbi:MAG TPA: hypothetical protein VGM31_11690 [Puia sp.]
MKHPKYPVKADDERYLYEFFSEGPRGSIKKTVIYSQIEEDFFNLSFGDWNENLNRLDDSSRTNNGDRNKVLATVAYTALDFTAKFPHSQILIEGSTSARTRLYQMGIADTLLEIKKKFIIFGYFKEHWEPFLRGKNYEAFLIQKK